MLTILTPDQVSGFWDVIKYAIEQSLPPVVGEHPDKMNRILSSLLSAKLLCWASYTREGEQPRFEGIVLTSLLFDEPSNTRNLLLYCLYGYEGITDGSWLSGLGSIVKYAKSKKCSKIVGYTEVPYLVDLAKSFGGEASYTFISLDVDKTVKLLNNLD